MHNKYQVGRLPLAPLRVLETVYGRVVRRMTREQFLEYCKSISRNHSYFA